MKIEIDDEVWNLYKKSWALFGVRDDRKLVEMLEDQMWQESSEVIEDSKKQLMDDTPEAYVQREIGLEEEQREKEVCKTKIIVPLPPWWGENKGEQ